MTDNEIIKALECCNDCDCGGCPCLTEDGCKDINYAEILDLINRLQTENERLKSFEDKFAEFNSHIRVEDMLVCASSLGEWLEFCDNLKAEAYKEFAELIKEQKHECGCNFRKKPVYAVTVDKIDHLLKETVGEDE